MLFIYFPKGSRYVGFCCAQFSGVAGGRSNRRYIIPTSRAQLPNSLRRAMTRARGHLSLLREGNGQVIATPRLTG
jgi:hypothetical protein